MAVARNVGFADAVDLYITANDDWLSDSETPLVTELVAIAQRLDSAKMAPKGPPSVMLMEFRQCFNDLHRLRPEDTGTGPSGDPFEQGIADIMKKAADEAARKAAEGQ